MADVIELDRGGAEIPETRPPHRHPTPTKLVRGSLLWHDRALCPTRQANERRSRLRPSHAIYLRSSPLAGCMRGAVGRLGARDGRSRAGAREDEMTE